MASTFVAHHVRENAELRNSITGSYSTILVSSNVTIEQHYLFLCQIVWKANCPPIAISNVRTNRDNRFVCVSSVCVQHKLVPTTIVVRFRDVSIFFVLHRWTIVTSTWGLCFYIYCLLCPAILAFICFSVVSCVGVVVVLNIVSTIELYFLSRIYAICISKVLMSIPVLTVGAVETSSRSIDVIICL